MSDSERPRRKQGKSVPSRGSKPGELRGAAGKGRKPGTPNKATANAREAIAAFVDKNAGRLEGLLAKIEVENGPLQAYKCIQELLEYHVPKLARTELTGKDGGAVQAEVRTLIVTAIEPTK